MVVGVGEAAEDQLAVDQPPPVAHDSAEARIERPALGRFAVQQRDLVDIGAHAGQRKAEIGFAALLLDIERLERAAEHVRKQRTERHIDEGSHQHVARNLEVEPDEVERQRERRQLPEQRHIGEDRHDIGDEVERLAQHPADEQPAIVGDALVWVVDPADRPCRSATDRAPPRSATFASGSAPAC